MLGIQAAPRLHLHPQSDSSASNSSVEVHRQRRRDNPSSGRGKAKRTMTGLTTDSVSGSDAPQRTDNNFRYLEQVSPRFYHAPDPNNGTGPPFPPRIARNRVERPASPPRLLPVYTPVLEPNVPHEPPIVNEDFSPPVTQQLIETLTNATLAAVTQHLGSTGFLPRTTVDPQPPAPSLTRTAPDPSVYAQMLAPASAPTACIT